jgi:methyl-accepting chemotaxis protein
VTLEPQSEPTHPSSGMSLDVKVLGAVGILVMLLVIAIALAVAFIIVLGTGANAAERQARYSAAIDAAALHAKGLANDERGYLISGSTEFLAQIDVRTELARSAFASAAEAADSGQRSTIAEAREGFERWLDTLEGELAAYQAGDEAAAVETSLGTSRSQRKAYEGWLSDAKSLGVAAFQDATASVADASSRSVMILLVYLVVAVAVAVTVALWVVRTVLRPAYTLVRLLADSDEQPNQGVAR